MAETFNALLDQPILLLIVLAVGAVIGTGVEKYSAAAERAKRQNYWSRRNARGSRESFRKPFRAVPLNNTPMRIAPDAADQLRSVMDAQFKQRALLNKPERRLLSCIDKALAECSPGWRAMAQVSLGEILYSHDKEAFWAINAKRVDLLIVDTDCRPLHAIEFQGIGHHKGPDAAARDAVKKEALRRAGIGYVEVVSGDTPAEVHQMVRKLVGTALRSQEGFGRKVPGETVD